MKLGANTKIETIYDFLDESGYPYLSYDEEYQEKQFEVDYNGLKCIVARSNNMDADDLTPNTFSYFIKVGGRVINNSAKDVPKILDYLKSRYAEGGLTMKAPKLLAPNGKKSNLNEVQYHLVRTPAFKAWFGDWENSPETASKVVDKNGEPLPVYHGSPNNDIKKFKPNYDGIFFSDKLEVASSVSGSELITENKITKAEKKILDKEYDDIYDYNFLFNDLKKIGYKIDISRKEFTDKYGNTELNNVAEITNLYGEKQIHKLDYFRVDWQKRGIILRGRNYQVFLNIRNPIIVNAKGSEWDNIEYEDKIINSGDIGVLAQKNKNDGSIIKNLVEYYIISDVFLVFNSNQIKLADGINTTFDSNNPDIRYNNGGLTIKEPKLLAPNGKKSNLNEVQYHLVRTPAFKAWFGDWENSPETSSKVVDENGEPLIVYHGSKKEFTIFKDLHKEEKYKPIFFFAKNIINSKFYGKNIYTTFLNIRNPKIYIESFDPEIYIDEKFDGVIIKRNKNYDNWYVATESYQIKLADGTNTTFDANNPDIRYNNGGLTIESKLLAPNGKPSKLTPEQYKLVRTPEFKAWFGDWENSPETSSKVVDEETKEPKVMYHGSKNDFTIFNPKAEAINRRQNFEGFYFTGNKDRAESYSNVKLFEVFINIRNPLNRHLGEHLPSYKSLNYIREKYKGDFNKEYLEQKIFQLQRTGRNSFIDGEDMTKILIMDDYDGVFDGSFDYGDTVAFNSTQIKLADGTNTTFDANNPDIRYKKGGTIDNGEANYGKYWWLTEVPLIHEASSQNAKQILKYGFNKSTNKHITNGVYTIPLPFKPEKFDSRVFENQSSNVELIVWLKEGSKIFWTNSVIPTEYYVGNGNIFYKRLYNDLNKGYRTPKDDFTDEDSQADFSRRMESWLKNNGYVGVQQGGEVVITDFNAIESIEIFNREQYDRERYAEKEKIKPKESKLYNGGELTLTSEQVEQKLGRALHWWNDNTIEIEGKLYKKVYLRPEYKLI